MQNRIIKLKFCPDCGNTCDGNSCRCGWSYKKTKRFGVAKMALCKFCNQIGDHGGLCKMHFEKQAEHAYKKRMAEYEESANDVDG